MRAIDTARGRPWLVDERVELLGADPPPGTGRWVPMRTASRVSPWIGALARRAPMSPPVVRINGVPKR